MCAAKGLKEQRFYYWRRELKARDTERKHRGSGFVELVTGLRADGQRGVRIKARNGLSIEVERGFDAETLKAALAVVVEVGRR